MKDHSQQRASGTNEKYDELDVLLQDVASRIDGIEDEKKDGKEAQKKGG